MDIKEKLIDKIISYNYSEFGSEFGNALVDLKQENQQLKIQVSSREEVANKYKEVIEEVRECIKKNYHLNWYTESNYKDELLQILDKGESNE